MLDEDERGHLRLELELWNKPQTMLPDGMEAGGAAYADSVTVGETVMLGPGKTVRVLAIGGASESSRRPGIGDS